uniref:NADH-ubiquinone oxidoreductase chain 3 n=1 Tax=Odontoglaja guamensis TaxID=259595 RepID=E6Y1B5_9GAST|nr:NADH dehydrogenase subunit 3 [Odontoglaja guamensis]
MFFPTMLISIILAFILLFVYNSVSYDTYTDMGEKASAFECGFDPISNSRSPFSTRFFMLIVIFLIFDVEVALIFPILSMTSYFTSTTSLLSFSFFIFLLVLTLGTFHEMNEGALDWISS